MLTFILKPINKETATVGSKVYNPSHGFGTITEISSNEIHRSYPITVLFDRIDPIHDHRIISWYTLDGKNECSDEYPIIFHVPPMLTKTYRVNTIETFVKIIVDTINGDIK